MFVGFFIISWQIFLIILPILIFKILAFQNIITYFLFVFFAVFFIGTRMRALGNIIHECCHATFVPNRNVNSFIGHLLCILEFSCFDTYRRDHFSHHRYLGDPVRDQDFKVRRNIGICDKKALNIKSFMFILFKPMNWFIILKSSISFYYKNKKFYVYRFLYVLFLGLFCYFIGFKEFLFFIVLPFITSYQFMKIFSDLLDHGGSYFNENHDLKTRNHCFSFPPLNWLLFPRSDCFHLVHHLYPTLPTTKLLEKHKILSRQKESYGKRKHCIF